MNRVPRVRASIAAVVTLAGLVVGATGTPAAADTATFSTSTPTTIQDPAQQLTNSTTLTPADNDTAGDSSSIDVSGRLGDVYYVAVDLTGLTHPSPDDLDITLVAPNGTVVPLLSDVGGTTPVGPIDLSIDDSGLTAPDDGGLSGGATYRPTDDQPGEALPAGAVRSASSLDSLTRSNPNGEWTLHVADDTAGGTGSISGWTLYLVEYPSSDPSPSTVTVSGLPHGTSDVKVTLTGLSHSYPDDLDVVLVAPDGTSSTIMSDAGGNNGLSDTTIHLDDQASSPLPDEDAIVSGGSYRPTNYDTDPDDVDLLTTDGTDFGVFDGVDPNGEWDLYVLDDNIGDEGTLAGWSLSIAPVDPPVTPTINPELALSPLDDTGATISGTGGPGNSITLQGLPIFARTLVGSNGAWSIDTGPLPDNDYTLRAVASDGYGQARSSTPLKVTFAVLAPTGSVSLLKPDRQPAVRINKPQVFIRIATTSQHLVGLRISNDGAPYGALIPWDGVSDVPWTLGSHDGSRRIFVQLQNAAGKVSGNLSTAVALDQTPPRVITVSPAAGATGIRHGKAVTARLSEAVDPYYATHGSAVLYRVGSSTPVRAVLRYDPDTRTISIHPTRPLRADARYRVVVSGSHDLAGNWQDQDPTLAGRQRMVWRFRAR